MTIKLSQIKCIIWDLDETLWRGTISEEDVVLNEEFKIFIMNCLDAGIVYSICSKNDYEKAKRRLTELGIWECFVFTSINWEHKGARVKQIIEKMKLRAENVLFIDDNVQNLKEAQFFSEGLIGASPFGEDYTMRGGITPGKNKSNVRN